MNDDFALDLDNLISQCIHGAYSGYGIVGNRASGKEFTTRWFKRLAEEFSDLTKQEIAQALSDHLSAETNKDLQDSTRMKASRSSTDDNQNELEQAWESSILNGIK